MTPYRRCLLLLCGMVLLANGGCAKPEWKEFSSEGGSYSVQFPGAPKHEVRNSQIPDGSFQLHSDEVALNRGKLAYAVTYADFPPEVQAKGVPAKQFLENSKQSVAGAGINITSSKDITFEGNPGTEFQGQDKKGVQLRVRIIALKKRFYQVSVASTNLAELADADAEKFFASFKLNNPSSPR